jgi:hypothetical protein
MNVITNGRINWRSKPRELTNQNLIQCLQRYGVLRYEIMIQLWILSINNIVLEIIPREGDFDLQCRTENLPGKANAPRSASRIMIVSQ